MCLNELRICWTGPEITIIRTTLARVLLVVLTYSKAFWIAYYDARGGSAFKFKIVEGNIKLPKESWKY